MNREISTPWIFKPAEWAGLTDYESGSRSGGPSFRSAVGVRSIRSRASGRAPAARRQSDEALSNARASWRSAVSKPSVNHA